MNKIDELRNYADNLRIKNEVKNDTLKRYELLVKELKNENKKLKQEIKELKKEVLAKYSSDLEDRIDYTTKQMKKYERYDRDFEIVLSNIVVILGDDKE